VKNNYRMKKIFFVACIFSAKNIHAQDIYPTVQTLKSDSFVVRFVNYIDQIGDRIDSAFNVASKSAVDDSLGHLKDNLGRYFDSTLAHEITSVELVEIAHDLF
jgi:hypothetical protein